MREVEFRVFYKGFMYLQKEIITDAVAELLFYSEFLDKYIDFDSPFLNLNGKFELMQFTGLKDKNGLTNIYEYDILDINGIIIGNYYENGDLLKDKSNLLVQGFGTSTWEATNKKAMERGCKYTE